MEKRLRVTTGFDLSGVDPASTPKWKDGKAAAEKALAAGAAELGDLQEQLYAASLSGGQRRILLVLQGMDTSGKGGTVQHALAGIDPHGMRIHSFKAPTRAELRHDFLWRVRKQLPPAGFLGVFDRSHYEDVLIARVRSLKKPEIIEQRYDLINQFEAELVDADTTVIKIMLHISADEQKARLLSRLDRPDKRWKYNTGDVDERELWPQYQEAYQLAVTRTSTEDAPWYVVPADHKWYSRLAVQRILLHHLREVAPGWPLPDYDVKVERKRVDRSLK
jgi:PPK2 family polyphosphate:nucleotide phosphotransferase